MEDLCSIGNDILDSIGDRSAISVIGYASKAKYLGASARFVDFFTKWANDYKKAPRAHVASENAVENGMLA